VAHICYRTKTGEKSGPALYDQVPGEAMYDQPPEDVYETPPAAKPAPAAIMAKPPQAAIAAKPTPIAITSSTAGPMYDVVPGEMVFNQVGNTGLILQLCEIYHVPSPDISE